MGDFVGHHRLLQGKGHAAVSVVCGGMEFRGRKRFVLRTDSEHAISALSTAVCQARTEGTSLANALKFASASADAIEVANRLVEARIRTIRGRREQVIVP